MCMASDKSIYLTSVNIHVSSPTYLLAFCGGAQEISFTKGQYMWFGLAWSDVNDQVHINP